MRFCIFFQQENKLNSFSKPIQELGAIIKIFAPKCQSVQLSKKKLLLESWSWLTFAVPANQLEPHKNAALPPWSQPDAQHGPLAHPVHPKITGTTSEVHLGRVSNLPTSKPLEAVERRPKPSSKIQRAVPYVVGRFQLVIRPALRRAPARLT